MIPANLERAVYGMYATHALGVADRQGVFEHMTRHSGDSTGKIAAALAIDEDTLERLLLVLSSFGVLTSAAELLNVVFHALRTLTPELFMGFREATGSASAVQSLNYHLMELVVYGYDERKIETYQRFTHLAPISNPLLREFTSLRDAAAGARDADVREAFAASEAPLHIWRGRHYGFGRRYLPEMTGSGGTEGAGYLKRFVGKAGLSSGDRTDDAERLLTHFAFC
ncbi:hypothetical protein ACLMNJ_24725 [Streptomyces seoulensis]